MKNKADVLKKAKELNIKVPANENWMKTRSRVSEVIAAKKAKVLAAKAKAVEKEKAAKAKAAAKKKAADEKKAESEKINVFEVRVTKRVKRPDLFCYWTKRGTPTQVTWPCPKEDFEKATKAILAGDVHFIRSSAIVRKTGLLSRMFVK